MADGHLKREFFLSLMDGKQDKDQLIRRLRDHLLEICPTCQAAYQDCLAERSTGSGPAVLLAESVSRKRVIDIPLSVCADMVRWIAVKTVANGQRHGVDGG